MIMEKTDRIRKIFMLCLAVLLLAVNVYIMILLLGSNRNASSDYGVNTVSDGDGLAAEGPVSSAEEPMSEEEKAAADQLVDKMILYYGSYGSKADQKVDELLTELNGINAGYGELWTKIMDYWDYINTDFVVNEDAVPDDLPEGDNLCIIVLGHKLAPEGTIRYELNGRLERALECAEKYPNAWVMCTGGGTASHNKTATEAGQMCQWFIQKGLDSSRLIKEDKSKTTVENAQNCYDILTRKYPQVDSVLLVSSRYHLKWGDLLFEASFMKSSNEKNKPMIHVVSNYAFPKDSAFYKTKYNLRWQAAGMLELVGDEENMNAFTYDDSYAYLMTHKKPKL